MNFLILMSGPAQPVLGQMKSIWLLGWEEIFTHSCGTCELQDAAAPVVVHDSREYLSSLEVLSLH